MVMMMSSNDFILAICICIIMGLGVWCCGEVDSEAPMAMEKAEQAALYSAIQGFVGNWWNGSDLYPDPCGWTPIQGVSCDIFGGLWYVKALSIGPVHDNSLGCATKSNVEFRPQLFQLKHLKSLSFFNCFISRHPLTIPGDQWQKLADSLELLEFRSNPGLRGQLPPTFGHLTKLQSLVLVENGLTGELPTNIGNLTDLYRLVLAGNGFTGQIPDSFGRLKKLLILDLSRNCLSGHLPSALGGLTSLLKLDMSYNQLEGKLVENIAYLKNLTLLDLRNNKLCGGLTQSIVKMQSLEELVLSNNPLGGDVMSIEWQRLQNLVILDLSNVGLIGKIPEWLRELKRLRYVGLGNNNLTGDIPPKLASLPSLTALYLNGNNLTGVLKFSEEFYGKMGRRFGAWNNPNLCYPVAVGLTTPTKSNAPLIIIPYGVKPCQRGGGVSMTLLEPNSRAKLKLGDSNLNQNSHLVSSLGYSYSSSYYGIHGLRRYFLVDMDTLITLLVVLNLYL